jgi:hypothetical protein
MRVTCFDAPSCTYLYIDKKMQDHGLFQAICRKANWSTCTSSAATPKFPTT